jgi:hypothetical protein
MTSHVDDKPTTPMVGRRAVARGAAWSIPVVALAVAAPASAATSTGCKVVLGTVVWKNLPATGHPVTQFKFGAPVTTSVGGLTLTVTASGDTAAANNGVVTTGPIGGATSLLLLHSQNGKNNTTQTITLKFSKKVQNLQFTLLDIDSSADLDKKGNITDSHWQDKVSILPAPSGQTLGTTVQGSGTVAAPWKAKTNNTVVADGQTTANVKLNWGAAMDTVTIVYSQTGSQDGSPKVGISDLSFQTVC